MVRRLIFKQAIHDTVITTNYSYIIEPFFAQSITLHQKRPWSTMECSKPAAWTTNRSLLVVSHAKAFPGRPTNSDSTLPRAVHLEGGVTRSHQCLHLAFAMFSGITRHTTNHPGFGPHACHPPPPSVNTHQTTLIITNYAHPPSVINSPALHAQR